MVFGAEISLCGGGISVELEGGALEGGALEPPETQTGFISCHRCSRVGGKEGTPGRIFESHKVHSISMDGC